MASVRVLGFIKLFLQAFLYRWGSGFNMEAWVNRLGMFKGIFIESEGSIENCKPEFPKPKALLP